MAAKEKKGFHFESLSVLSIFCHKNKVFPKKKSLDFEFVSDFGICNLQGGGVWHNALTLNTLLVATLYKLQ